MSDVASLITPIVARPKTDNDDSYLIIEQEPWAKGVGKVTRLDLVRALESVIFAEESEVEIDCGLDDGGSSYTTLVYVYPSPESLAFNVGLTNGTLSEPTLVELQVKEAVDFSLTDQGELTYPVKNVISSAWAADVWDAAGSVVSASPPVVDGQTAEVDEVIYGTAYIEYTTLRYVYAVQVFARDEDPENVFQSVFYAWWNGGIEMLEIDAPDGAEHSYTYDVRCDGGSNVIIDPDDDEDPPRAVPVNKTITLDYCDNF